MAVALLNLLPSGSVACSTNHTMTEFETQRPNQYDNLGDETGSSLPRIVFFFFISSLTMSVLLRGSQRHMGCSSEEKPGNVAVTILLRVMSGFDMVIYALRRAAGEMHGVTTKFIDRERQVGACVCEYSGALRRSIYSSRRRRFLRTRGGRPAICTRWSPTSVATRGKDDRHIHGDSCSTTSRMRTLPTSRRRKCISICFILLVLMSYTSFGSSYVDGVKHHDGVQYRYGNYVDFANHNEGSSVPLREHCRPAFAS